MEELKEGDVVRLKSGGPQMTVEVVGRGRAKCVFFDSNNQIKREVFLTNNIELAEDTGKQSDS